MAREFEGLMNRFFGDWPVSMTEPVAELEPWAVETEELENEVVLHVPVPGFALPELNVEVTGDVVTVRAEHAEAAPAGEGAPAATAKPPRLRTRVHRTLTLPVGTDAARLEARYRNGILELHLPRTVEARPRRIDVKV
jgi:HSP20 family protein